MPELFDLAQYGVAALSIGALVYVVNKFLKFISNHLEKHTEVDADLANVVRELLDWLKYNNRNSK